MFSSGLAVNCLKSFVYHCYYVNNRYFILLLLIVVCSNCYVTAVGSQNYT